MITKGDEECIWAVRRTASKSKDHASIGKENDYLTDPHAILKVRLAKGEISLEEYERILRVL
jgi:uncharacterized membrane protein